MTCYNVAELMRCSCTLSSYFRAWLNTGLAQCDTLFVMQLTGGCAEFGAQLSQAHCVPAEDFLAQDLEHVANDW